MHLLEIKRVNRSKSEMFPFNIMAIKNLNSLKFSSPVTIFIGENGTGKTTFLESIVSGANIVKLIPDDFLDFDAADKLSNLFIYIWKNKTRKGFYLKSQSFIFYTRNIEKIKHEANEAIKKIEIEYKDKSVYAKNLAMLPYKRSLSELDRLYGEGLDKMSHGEGYIELFKSRLIPGGLYLLDEPELSLSPMRQLALISLIKEMIMKDCQFIIITHSPILMACENTTIYNFSDDNIHKTEYSDVEHVKLIKDFLNSPQSYLKYL